MARRRGARVPTFLLHRQAGTARRDDSLAACRPGERFQHFTPRGVSFPARRGGGPLSCCIGKRGLRGGTIVWRHADREGVFSVLRRAVCCVGAGPAGRCGYFSFSAYRRRQRKVPGKEARHSYFFEGGSLQLDKSCRKEAGTAAFLSASHTPKGKKSRPKERSWLPQARGRSENGGGPACAAERRAGRSGQRSLRGVNCTTARSARSGHGTRGRPSGQQPDKAPPHSTASTNPSPQIHPQNLSHAAKRILPSLCPRLIQREALRMHVFPKRPGWTGAQAIRAHDFFSGRFS